MASKTTQIEHARGMSSINHQDLDLAQNAPADIRAEALVRAIISYNPYRWYSPGSDPLVMRIDMALRELGKACDPVAAAVAYGCRDKPRKDLLSRLAIVGWGASRSLGAGWADNVALSLTQARSWWP